MSPTEVRDTFLPKQPWSATSALFPLIARLFGVLFVLARLGAVLFSLW